MANRESTSNLDSQSFMRLLGQELAEVFREGKEYYGPDKNLAVFQKDIITEANHRLQHLPFDEKRKVLLLFWNWHKTRLIGDYKVRVDLRDEGDFCEELVSLLEAILENELNMEHPG